MCYTTSKGSEWRRCWHVKGPVCPGVRLITSKAVSRVERQIQFYWIPSSGRAQCRLCVLIPVLQMKVCPVPRSERVSCVGFVFLSSFGVSWWVKKVAFAWGWKIGSFLMSILSRHSKKKKLRSVSKFSDEKLYLEHLGLCHSSAELYSTGDFWKGRLRVLP